ncbi:MAG: RidA family protein [Pseudomonadota bacterium]
MLSPEENLAALGLALPDAPAPVANYVPFVATGNLLFVSGQVSFGPDGLVAGVVGETIDVEAAQSAAKLCALNLLAQVNAACGSLDRVARVVKLGGFVNCTPDFADHPKVINGASDLMVDVFGDRGKHARAAVGAPSLPLGAAVEVDGVFEIG